jgi:hypothetical protein
MLQQPSRKRPTPKNLDQRCDLIRRVDLNRPTLELMLKVVRDADLEPAHDFFALFNAA